MVDAGLGRNPGLSPRSENDKPAYKVIMDKIANRHDLENDPNKIDFERLGNNIASGINAGVADTKIEELAGKTNKSIEEIEDMLTYYAIKHLSSKNITDPQMRNNIEKTARVLNSKGKMSEFASIVNSLLKKKTA